MATKDKPAFKTTFRKAIEGQLYQVFVFVAVYTFVLGHVTFVGLNKVIVFLAFFSALAHHLWVSFFWRSQLYFNLFSTKPGAKTVTSKIDQDKEKDKKKSAWFLFYKVVFAGLFLYRAVAIVLLSIEDSGSLNINEPLRISLLVLIHILGGYGLYSVIRYFGVSRAFGSDHFYPEVRRTGFVRQGIFRYTSNGMYTAVILVIYIFPLLWSSLAGLIAALFHHLFLWVHYFVTEKPDINVMYGSTENDTNK